MSNVRTAVERAQAQPPAAAQVSLAQVVRQAIERQSRGFRAVLPKHVDPERFSRLVLAAVKSTPQLMECFATEQGELSVLLAAMQAAAVGLEPNTPTKEAWLLPRRNNQVMECQLSIGYRGLMKLARRSGTIKTIYAEVVRDGDHFVWERGLDEDRLEHKPLDDEDRELTHAYAVARFVEGGYAFVVLNRRQVEKRRAVSESWKNPRSRPYSPWTQWPEEMWKKTAIRALEPYLELSPQTATAFAADEARLSWNDDDGLIEVAAVDDVPALAGGEVDAGEEGAASPGSGDDRAQSGSSGEAAAASPASPPGVEVPDPAGLPDDVDSLEWLRGLDADSLAALAGRFGLPEPQSKAPRHLSALLDAVNRERGWTPEGQES